MFLTSFILALRAAVVAKLVILGILFLVILGISFLTSFILDLKVVSVVKLVISSIIS